MPHPVIRRREQRARRQRSEQGLDRGQAAVHRRRLAADRAHAVETAHHRARQQRRRPERQLRTRKRAGSHRNPVNHDSAIGRRRHRAPGATDRAEAGREEGPALQLRRRHDTRRRHPARLGRPVDRRAGHRPDAPALAVDLRQTQRLLPALPSRQHDHNRHRQEQRAERQRRAPARTPAKTSGQRCPRARQRSPEHKGQIVGRRAVIAIGVEPADAARRGRGGRHGR